MSTLRRPIVTCVADRAHGSDAARPLAGATATVADAAREPNGRGRLRHLRDTAPPALRARIVVALRSATPVSGSAHRG